MIKQQINSSLAFGNWPFQGHCLPGFSHGVWQALWYFATQHAMDPTAIILKAAGRKAGQGVLDFAPDLSGFPTQSLAPAKGLGILPLFAWLYRY